MLDDTDRDSNPHPVMTQPLKLEYDAPNRSVALSPIHLAKVAQIAIDPSRYDLGLIRVATTARRSIFPFKPIKRWDKISDKLDK